MQSRVREKTARRLLVGIGVPILVIGGFAIVYFYDPDRNLLPIPCLFNMVTGLDCIGCGTTRALNALAHGKILTALSHNLITPFWLLLPAYALLGEWLRAVVGRPVLPPIRDHRWMLILLLVSSLLFFVLRNLPWEPFTWLAATADPLR
jgi:ABC-type branched-subunit amino acid transport system permease subunit